MPNAECRTGTRMVGVIDPPELLLGACTPLYSNLNIQTYSWTRLGLSGTIILVHSALGYDMRRRWPLAKLERVKTEWSILVLFFRYRRLRVPDSFLPSFSFMRLVCLHERNTAVALDYTVNYHSTVQDLKKMALSRDRLLHRRLEWAKRKSPKIPTLSSRRKQWKKCSYFDQRSWQCCSLLAGGFKGAVMARLDCAVMVNALQINGLKEDSKSQIRTARNIFEHPYVPETSQISPRTMCSCLYLFHHWFDDSLLFFSCNLHRFPWY